MFLAHISEDKTREQSIKDHAIGTAKMAGDFAAFFDCYEWGYGCGLVHDIGKYSKSFQHRLKGGPITDHATAGAQELFKKKYYAAAYCVAGHHSGLPDGGTPVPALGREHGASDGTLMGRMEKQVDDYRNFSEDIEIPTFPRIPLQPLGNGGFSFSFFTRMLFSCLVDGDYLDTESFMREEPVQRGSADTIEILYKRLEQHVSSWLCNQDRLTINGRRSEILRHCFTMGLSQPGVYQLTVPTGGGKTVSSLAFALEHARKHDLQRIIYVIPYTTIIEQTAQIFKNILGNDNVLEDHSNVIFEDEKEYDSWKLATENWDKKLVISTNVQFFESLFANKTSKCRKLHNIAKSVIIFDEAQMLPLNYLKPCLQAISELVINYHCTAVLCTATQPSLSQYFPEQINVRQICPDVTDQFAFFKRTVIVQMGEISEEMLIQHLREQKQALCILNSRKRVQRIYKELEGEGTYHLSTFMYPVHRKRQLGEIKDRLRQGLSCRVVATSLVEAGVDLDFVTVFRELAGIDSVIQAAGRCNREGKRSCNDCNTFVFKLEKTEGIHVPNSLKLSIAVGEAVSEEYTEIDSPDAVAGYFNQLYHFRGESLDKKGIVEMFEKENRSLMFPFATAAKQFRLIENETVTLLIDIEEEARKLADRLRHEVPSRQLLRDAGMYCINIYEHDFEKLNGAGLLETIPYGYYLLRRKEDYKKNMGLVIEAERGDALLGY